MKFHGKYYFVGGVLPNTSARGAYSNLRISTVCRVICGFCLIRTTRCASYSRPIPGLEYLAQHYASYFCAFALATVLEQSSGS